MVTSSLVLTSSFSGHMSTLNAIRRKMEKLFLNDQIVRRDIEQVYIGLYIDAVTSFERKIEELFIGLLVGRIVHPSSNVSSRITVGTDKIAKEVLLNGKRRYLDWFPYDLTQDRAKIYFKKGKPFQLESVDIDTINGIIYIRNLIAHKSEHSKKKFLKNVIGTLSISAREKTPAGFLRGIYRSSPLQTRYEYYVSEMLTIVSKLCA